MAVMTSDPLLPVLAEALGVPDLNSVRRVVIDIRPGCAPVVHIEQFGNERLIAVMQALDGMEITRAER